MKYLRKFNENVVDELKDFCETSLAYLVDEGFNISFLRIGIDGVTEAFTQVNIYKGTRDNGQTHFNWESVQDHIIPFLQLLQKKYKLNTFSKEYGPNRVVGVYSNDLVKAYSVEQLVSSQLPTRFPRRIKKIRIRVADKILS